jgi:hypothetical protein
VKTHANSGYVYSKAEDEPGYAWLNKKAQDEFGRSWDNLQHKDLMIKSMRPHRNGPCVTAHTRLTLGWV